MFGYVIPLREELKVRELGNYQAVYCGLCHTLGRRYGLVARMFLSYDFTFLAMILANPLDKPAIEHRRCIACPIRGKDVCISRYNLDVSADESVILSYWKLQDNVMDSSFFRGLPARFASMVLRPSYRKAAARHIDFDQKTGRLLTTLRSLEDACSSSLDHTADTFAQILSCAAPPTGEEDRDRAVEQLLYHVGRWIYLLDAWDDLKEDRIRGGYNPLIHRFPDGPEHHQEEFRTTLRHSLNLAVSAYNLTDFGPWNGILLNILCLGLPMVEEAVFSGQWRQLKKQTGRTRYERSV